MIDPRKGDFFRISTGGRTMLVEIAAVKNDGTITGWRVTKTGERFETETKTTVSQHLVIFRLANLRQRMQMNLHFAELEPA